MRYSLYKVLITIKLPVLCFILAIVTFLVTLFRCSDIQTLYYIKLTY